MASGSKTSPISRLIWLCDRQTHSRAPLGKHAEDSGEEHIARNVSATIGSRHWIPVSAPCCSPPRQTRSGLSRSQENHRSAGLLLARTRQVHRLPRAQVKARLLGPETA